jgi:hypothetical protein
MLSAIACAQGHPTQQQQQPGSFDAFAQSSGHQMGWQQQQQQQAQPYYGHQQQAQQAGVQSFGGFHQAAMPATQMQASFGAMGLGGPMPLPAGKPAGQVCRRQVGVCMCCMQVISCTKNVKFLDLSITTMLCTLQAPAPTGAANAPLNPAATPIVSTRSKDPFADLAAF